jgi:DNA/RNA-binding protein KIN17
LALGSAASKKKKKGPTAAAAAGISSVLGADDEDEESEEEIHGNEKKQAPPAVAAKSSNEQAGSKQRTSSDHDAASRKRPRVEEEKASSRTDSWLYRDILVRIISKKLAGGNYYKRKAVVDRVLDDKFTAEVEVLDSGPEERDGGDILRLDQDDLETVVPKEGKKVRILKGRLRGERAKVVSLDKKKYLAVLELEDGTVLERVDYEDFSKLA